MVSWTVAIVLNPAAGGPSSALPLAGLVAGVKRMRALDVFFWRRE